MSDDIENKLSAARTRLILDKPFLGALVLRLPMVKGSPDWCHTSYTDAKKFYYNAEYIDTISNEHTQFVLAKQALHCALSHFARRGHRVKHRWEMACDFAVNPILISEGLEPPADVFIMHQYDGMTAEEIYPLLDDNENDQDRDLPDDSDDDNDDHDDNKSDQKNDDQSDEKDDKDDSQGGGTTSQDEHSDKGGSPQQQPGGEGEQSGNGAAKPPPLTESEKDALSTQWQQRMAGAAQQAMAAGKMGESMMRLVDFLLQPQLPWRSLLARYMNSIARDDYNFSRPSSRRGGPALFPSLRSAQLNVTIALDISGSVSDAEIKEFVSEIDAIKGQVRARVTMLACDAELAAGCPWEFEPWEEFAVSMKFKGGGGTRFTPVFDWVSQQDTLPDLLVYFTDAQGEFPDAEPPYSVLWLVKGKDPVPFGNRIQLN